MSKADKPTTSPTSSDEAPKPLCSIAAFVTGYAVEGCDDVKYGIEIYGTGDNLEAAQILRNAADILFAADETGAGRPKH